MEPAVVELGPHRRLTARDAGADVMIVATPRNAEGAWFLFALYGLPAVALTALAVTSNGALGVVLVLGALACGWLALGIVRDRRRERALDAAIAGCRLIIRARDAIVLGPGEREEVIALDAVVDHPILYRRPEVVVALVRARQMLVAAKPGSPRRLVLEAAAIEAAVLGGFEHPKVFVVLRGDGRASQIVAIETDEAALSTDEDGDTRVYAVPTEMYADDRRYPIINVARVIEKSAG